MTRTLLRLALLPALLCGGPGSAIAETIPLTPDRWEAQGEIAFEEKGGRRVMRLGAPATGKRGGAVAAIKGLSLGTGVVEFDVMLPDAMEFSGPLFRQPDENNGEFIYFRPHMSGKPDAVQYTPVVNGNLAWQIFGGTGFEAEASLPAGRWLRVRLDLYPASALLSVDGKKLLHIPALKGGASTGTLGFGSLMGGTYYSNVTVEPIAGHADPAPPPPAVALAEGTVEAFEVSEAMTEAAAFERARQMRWEGTPWHRIAVESNGIANLSKAGADGAEAHSFIARFTISAKARRTAEMRLAFSDDVRLFLNGRPLYAGSDRQGSRDYRFLGHAGFWDTVFLDLKPGANEVAMVVTDPTNGGTAAGAIIAPEAPR
jgi:hypothetical protein